MFESRVFSIDFFKGGNSGRNYLGGHWIEIANPWGGSRGEVFISPRCYLFSKDNPMVPTAMGGLMMIQGFMYREE